MDSKSVDQAVDELKHALAAGDCETKVLDILRSLSTTVASVYFLGKT